MTARLLLGALVASALLLQPAGVVSAQDAKPRSQTGMVLRGVLQPEAPDAVPPSQAAAPVPDPLSGLDPKPAPRFSYDPASRQGGLSVAPGGARCRQACAQTLYACRVNDDEQACNPSWTQCVAACPEGSSDF